MILKCLAIFGAAMVVAVQAATLHQKNIPVHVVYEQPKSLDSDQLMPEIQKEAASSNVEEKVQVPETSAMKEPSPNFVNALKNMNEKVQLSTEELAESKLKNDKISSQVKNLEEKVQLPAEEVAVKHTPVKETEAVQQEKLEEVKAIDPSPMPSVATYTEDVTVSSLTKLSSLHEIAKTGLKRLRDGLKDAVIVKPKPEDWDELERSVDVYFEQEKSKLQSNISVRQQEQQQNFIQQIANGFQNITNSFIQNWQTPQGSNPNGTNQGDEGTGGQQGGFQNFISYFQGGIQNLINNFQNSNQGAPGNSTVLGDNGTGGSQQPPNFISGFVSGVQNFVQNFQGGSQGPGNGTQGDTGVNGTGSRPPGFFQGAISQFNQVVSNIIPSTQAPNTQGDEGTGSSPPGSGGPAQVFQNIGNQIGSAFNNFIQGAQGSATRPPSTSGDEGTGSGGAGAANQGQNFIQNIGNAIQNFNPFRPTPKPGQPPVVEPTAPSEDTGANPAGAGAAAEQQPDASASAKQSTNAVESNELNGNVPQKNHVKVDLKKDEIMAIVE